MHTFLPYFLCGQKRTVRLLCIFFLNQERSWKSWYYIVLDACICDCTLSILSKLMTIEEDEDEYLLNAESFVFLDSSVLFKNGGRGTKSTYIFMVIIPLLVIELKATPNGNPSNDFYSRQKSSSLNVVQYSTTSRPIIIIHLQIYIA